MKFRSHTGVAGTASGLIFFAECLDETLYEYTPATYKPRVMSVRSLTLEAKSAIERINSGAMDRSRLIPILDELRERLQGDPVAKSLLDFPAEYYTSHHKEEDLKQVKIRLGLLQNRLSGGRYRNALQHEIIRLCHSDKEKNLIRETARSWVSAICGIGYSRQFLRSIVTEEFFSGETKYFESPDLLNFFKKASGEKEDFEVIFSASKVIQELSDFFNRFSCKYIENGSDSCKKATNLGLTPGDNEILIMVKSVPARDAYTARNEAERRLEYISDLFAIFHHKNRIKWQPKAVAIRPGSDGELVNERTSSVKRSRDNIPKMASKKMAIKIGELRLSDRESAGRFVSVVRLHGAAQEAASPQAQLVNLWTAMEVLVSRDSDSKLRGVKRCITPFLVHGYFDRILYALAGDLYRWKRKPLSKILKSTNLSSWPQHHKLAVVLLGGDFEPIRDDLYNLLSEFPLLKNRIFQISELISSQEKLNSAIKSHEQRISWQIDRIYRARNSIIHDGSAPPQADTLTENAHDYLDAFIDRFFVICSEMKAASTLDEAIAYQSFLYDNWKKLLAKKTNTPIDANSVLAYCALGAPKWRH